MIVTIDGPSGTGKSTVAKRLAEILQATYFNSGALYRALAWTLIDQRIATGDLVSIKKELEGFHFTIKDQRFYVGEKDVTDFLRTEEIASYASKISAYPFVRKSLKPLQRKISHHNDIVVEGRDMGTVIFPEAEYKFFLTASPEVRAERRCKELKEKYPNREIDYEEVLEQIKQRDLDDSTRTESPLKRAKGAFLIDTTERSIDEVVDHMLLHFDKIKRLKPSWFPSHPMKLFYRFILFLSWCYLKLFFSLRIYGLEHFFEGGALVAANHASYLDPPILSTSVPQEVHFLARKSLFKGLFGKFISKLNAHPIKGEESNIEVMRLICKLLREGKKVIIFPEGQRTYDNTLGEIKPGISLLVAKANASILPAYIAGSYDAWPRGRKLPKWRGRIACVFGKRLRWSDYAHLDRKVAQQKLADDLQRSIKELKKWYEAGADGIP